MSHSILIFMFSLDLSNGTVYIYILVCGLLTKCVEFMWAYVVTDVGPYTDFIIKKYFRQREILAVSIYIL